MQPDGYDALIYTSAFDGLPNVVLEAMGWGLPVIAPDVGGISEAVRDGETGFLIPDHGDDDRLIAAYVAAIQRLYQDWARSRAMAEAGRALVAHRHNRTAHRERIGTIVCERRKSMSDERLHFDDPATMPNAMYAAEHMARYAMLAPFVRGKRVLDIACGEGYGSWFLKEWGAREVIGVDISADAIAVAKKRFSKKGVSFLAGDACRAQDFLAHASFDLIVSFETIEHVEDPQAFLTGLRSLASLEAGIFISCPNDHIAMAADQSNPYHLRKYTFEEFRDL